MNAYVRWDLLTLFICNLLVFSETSITGVTYRDNFDFEERYKNRHLCDPLYWHPLHMPEDCLKKYEKVIRSKVIATNPFKVMKKKETETFMNLLKQAERAQQQQRSEETSVEFDVQFQDISFEYPPYKPYLPYLQEEEEKDEDDEEDQRVDVDSLLQRSKLPYEVMLEMIQRDAWKLPAMPYVGLLPYLGAAAVYQQPISENTEDVIKKVAHVYSEVGQDTYKQSIYDAVSYSSNETVPDENNTTSITDKTLQPYDETTPTDPASHEENSTNKEPDQDEQTTPKIDRKNKVINKKITIGNLVAYYQERRRKP